MKKKINEVKRKLNIPLSLEQEGLKVEFRKWFGRNGENRFELIFTTKNSYVSHSLSREQIKALKEAVNSFQI